MAGASVNGKLTRIKAAIDTFHDFPKAGIVFRDIFSVLRDPDVFKDLIDVMTETIKQEKCEVVVALEARGFLFGPIIALALGVPFVPIRKKGKLPGEISSVSYKLEYGVDVFEMQTNALSPGKRVVIIDDLLATGGTLAASCELVKKAGAVVVCCLVVIELMELKGREHLPERVVSLIEL